MYSRADFGELRGIPGLTFEYILCGFGAPSTCLWHPFGVPSFFFLIGASFYILWLLWL